MRELVALDREKLNRARIEAGLPKCELADQCGLHVNTIMTALSGGRVSLRSARTVADALGFVLRDVIVHTPSAAEARAVVEGAAEQAA